MKINASKLTNGFLWNFGEKILTQLITFFVGIVLARKLGPSSYGLVATVSVIITFINVGSSLHTGTYLMRKKELDPEDMNTSFFFTLSVSVFLYFILFFLSPLISKIYNEPQITILLRVMGLTLPISSLMSIKMVLVVREYQYKKFFFISFIGTAIAGIVGIILAYLGFGPWALVAQHFLDCAIDTLFLWIFIKWTPKFKLSKKSLKAMINYGFPLWLFGILEISSSRLQSLIIGKRYSSGDLAFYNRGESLPSMIEANSTSALNNLLLKRASEDQDDFNAEKKLLNLVVKISLYIAVPVMLGLAVVAPLLIEILLGSEWSSCVFFIEIFCLAFVFKPIEVTSDILLKAVGKSKLYFLIGIIKKSFYFLSIVICVPISVKAIAIGFLVASICASLVSMIVNRVIFNLSIFKQMLNLIIPLIFSLYMCALVNRVGLLFSNLPSVLLLLIEVISGIIIYIALLFTFDRKTIHVGLKLFGSVTRKKK